LNSKQEQVLEVPLAGKRLMRLEITAAAASADLIACFQVLAVAFDVAGGLDVTAFSRYESEDPRTGRAVAVVNVRA
jgi:hypothetical protein